MREGVIDNLLQVSSEQGGEEGEGGSWGVKGMPGKFRQQRNKEIG